MKNLEIYDHQMTIKGLNIYYRTAGDQRNQAVVLLNGWGAKVRGIFGSERVIKEIARRGFFVYSPEHPGLMRSQTPKNIWGQEEYRAYLEDFIVSLDIINPIIIGQSFGGAIATAYAAVHSDSIKILVLVDAGLSSDKYLRHRLKLRFYSKKFSHYLLSKSAPSMVKKILIWIVLGIPWNFINKETFQIRSRMGEIFDQWKLDNVYSKITSPTIMIWGKNDMLFTSDLAETVSRELPNAKFYSVFGGHSVLYTQPKKIINLICEKL